MANQSIAVPPDSTGKKVQTFENSVGGSVVEAQALALVDQFGVPLAERGDNYLKVTGDPATLLYDTFEALDVTNTWTAGGSVAPAISAGYLGLNPGTAASASSTLVSKPAFAPGTSAFLQFAGLVALEAAATPGNQRVWGLGVFGTPTPAVPITNGTVYELDSASGGLFASVYSAGARTQSLALTRPADGLTHRYAIYYKASRAYFEMDNVVVATLAFPNPAVAVLSLVAASINGASALAAAPTLAVSLMGLGDTAHNAKQLSDGTFPWREATIKPATAAAAVNDTALVVALSPNSPMPLPALGKGTQGGTGLSVQNLVDAGRSNVNAYAETVAGATAETLFSLSVAQGFGVPATATSYTVPAGKTLRITHLSVSFVSTTTTATTSRVRLRVSASGAATLSSNLVWSIRLGISSSTLAVGETQTTCFTFPDGLELPAGNSFALSHIESGANGTIDVAMQAFLY